MQVTRTAIPEVLVIEPKVFGDDRGFFYESYNERAFADATGLRVRFVQDNHSRSGRTCCAACTTRSARPPAAGKAGARHCGRDLRRRGGHPQELADLREVGRRRALGGQQEDVLDSRRLRARLSRDQRPRRSAVQDDRLLRARARALHRLERPRSRHFLAAQRRADPVAEGPRRASAQASRSCFPDAAHPRSGQERPGRLGTADHACAARAR